MNAMADKEKRQNAPKMSPAEVKSSLKKIKKAVFELEKENDSHIFVYYSGNKWYKIGGNSAMIFYHILAPQIKGYKPNLRPDGDYDCKFETGVVSIRDFDTLKQRLKSLGVEQDKKFDTKNSLVFAFLLPKKVEQKELDKILNRKAVRRQELTDLLSLANSDPALAALIRETGTLAYHMSKSMKPVERDLVGQKLLSQNVDLYNAYRRWANGRAKFDVGLNEMLDIIDELSGYMLTIMENNIVDIDTIAKYTYKLEAMREAILKRRDEIPRSK